MNGGMRAGCLIAPRIVGTAGKIDATAERTDGTAAKIAAIVRKTFANLKEIDGIRKGMCPAMAEGAAAARTISLS